MMIREYVEKVHELIEKPRNELRCRVMRNESEEAVELLNKFEEAYIEKCLIIEKLLEEDMRMKERFE